MRAQTYSGSLTWDHDAVRLQHQPTAARLQNHITTADSASSPEPVKLFTATCTVPWRVRVTVGSLPGRPPGDVLVAVAPLASPTTRPPARTFVFSLLRNARPGPSSVHPRKNTMQ